MRRLAALALLVVAGAAGAVDDGPNARIDVGWVHLTAFPVDLDHDEIAPHLDSGLTTTFVIEVEAGAAEGDRRGGARVEIRFDLWDERYLVRTVTLDGRGRSLALDSREALAAWWRELELAVVPAPAAAIELGVEMRVLPFSRAEELETKRWFSDSVRRAEEGRQGEAGRSIDGSEGLGQMFDVLIATSIKGRAVTTFRWKVDVAGAEP